MIPAQTVTGPDRPVPTGFVNPGHEPYRRELTPVHDRLGKRVSVHDRLGGRTMLCDPVGKRVPAHDRLEQMADDRVQDDQPMRKDPEREPDRTCQSQWCLGGLTRSQK